MIYFYNYEPILIHYYLLTSIVYSLVAQSVKNLPAMWETWVGSLGREDPLGKEMATHSSILAWKISWTQEPGGLQSMGLERVGQDWVTNTYIVYSDFFSFFLLIIFFALKATIFSKRVLFNYLFLAVLGLHRSTDFSLVVTNRGCLSLQWPLIVEHGL